MKVFIFTLEMRDDAIIVKIINSNPYKPKKSKLSYFYDHSLECYQVEIKLHNLFLFSGMALSLSKLINWN